MSVAKRNLVIYVLSTVSHVQLLTILVASSRRVIMDGPWVTEYEQKPAGCSLPAIVVTSSS